ncbi:MAG: hypothetical protein CMQ34_08770 [Gammaproteobacteria bacterium]|nr:hypothetical protein [Gammaproteobacteria bacterium]|tara:strand:+ start:955 stop:1320 length:366 start_codon:yes stop_codon:yes gene_type:complete
MKLRIHAEDRSDSTNFFDFDLSLKPSGPQASREEVEFFSEIKNKINFIHHVATEHLYEILDRSSSRYKGGYIIDSVKIRRVKGHFETKLSGYFENDDDYIWWVKLGDSIDPYGVTELGRQR